MDDHPQTTSSIFFLSRVPFLQICRPVFHSILDVYRSRRRRQIHPPGHRRHHIDIMMTINSETENATMC